MTSDQPLVIDHLSKKYASAKNLALDSLSLTVAKGEIYGFLGPNGAGKSTTINLLLNFIQPTAGTATIFGHDVVTDPVALKYKIGFLSGEVPIFPKLRGKDFLNYLGQLNPQTDVSERDRMVKLLDADLSKPMGQLSRGNRQKIGIIQALMHKPDLLILDEPSSGLDPLMQEVVYSLLTEAKSRGAAVFMSSHIMSEVQKTCDRVGIIRQGKLIQEYDMQDLRKEAAQHFDIVFDQAIPETELKKLPGLEILSAADQRLQIQYKGDLSPLLKQLSSYKVVRFDSHELDLEAEFMQFYHPQEQSS